MNLFATDHDPKLAAQNLDDRRVVKLILESAQMLSTAVRLETDYADVYAPDLIYKVAHANHPCTLWVRASEDNFRWTLDHMTALNDIYHAAYGRNHASMALVPAFNDVLLLEILLPGSISPFAKVVRQPTFGIDCTEIPHPVDAYRHYLKEKWSGELQRGYMPRFKNRHVPIWLNDIDNYVYSRLTGRISSHQPIQFVEED
jgi:hypothetical protein